MSATPLVPQSLPVPAPASKQSANFEFTKRKRWRDLLSAEISDAFVLIVSAPCRVLYCGTAISEILGWSNHELVDGDLLEYIQPAERANFQRKFDQYMRSDAEFLSSYVYLKNKEDCTSTSTTSCGAVLFELLGQRLPAISPDATPVCFIMAKPYPGRNTETLNTFLALKIENERLQQRLRRLKTQSSPALPFGVSPPHVDQHASSSSAQQLVDSYSPLYGLSRTLDWDDRLPSPAGYDSGMNLQSFRDTSDVQDPSASKQPEDDNSEEGTRRKRLKRSQLFEQYVCITCGRTDSPEWRKGPHGPKTLCNACGLRWAKYLRKVEEMGEPAPSA